MNRETEQSKRKKNRELTNFLKKYLAKVKFFFIYIHSSSSSILVDKEKKGKMAKIRANEFEYIQRKKKGEKKKIMK